MAKLTDAVTSSLQSIIPSAFVIYFVIASTTFSHRSHKSDGLRFANCRTMSPAARAFWQEVFVTGACFLGLMNR
jgi:hypothetical protein